METLELCHSCPRPEVLTCVPAKNEERTKMEAAMVDACAAGTASPRARVCTACGTGGSLERGRSLMGLWKHVGRSRRTIESNLNALSTIETTLDTT